MIQVVAMSVITKDTDGTKPAREPIITIHLLNEIRKFCDSCATCSTCARAKSAGALTGCSKVSAHRSVLMEKAGVRDDR